MPDNEQNEIRIDYRDNPELAEAFAGKNEGDRCTLETTFMIVEKDANGLRGKIEKVAPEGYEPKAPTDGKDKEIEPDAQNEPVAVVINARKAMNSANSE